MISILQQVVPLPWRGMVKLPRPAAYDGNNKNDRSSLRKREVVPVDKQLSPMRVQTDLNIEVRWRNRRVEHNHGMLSSMLVLWPWRIESCEKKNQKKYRATYL